MPAQPPDERQQYPPSAQAYLGRAGPDVEVPHPVTPPSGAHRAADRTLWVRGIARSVAGGLVAIASVAGGIYLLQRLVPAPAGSPAVVSSPSTRPTLPSPLPTPTLSLSPSSAPPAVARMPLTVLNNSRRVGLAARAAAQFAAGGWPVREVGNYTGRVAVTTVYYPPGGEAAAALLRREFPAVRRMLPRFPGLAGSGLTVVLTRDYPA